MNISQRFVNSRLGKGVRGVLKRVSEMKVINRNYLLSDLTYRLQTYFNFFSLSPTVDESRVNYFLARALYKGSVISDEVGNSYGEEYLLSSPFSKAIVNATVAFMLNEMPRVNYEDASFDEYEDYVNQWIDTNSTDVFKVIQKALSEGDGYILIKNEFNAPVIRLRPENVTKIVNVNDYTDLIGYNVDNVVYETDSEDSSKINKIQYKTMYRKFAPYVVTVRTDKDNNHTVVKIDGEDTNIPYENPSFNNESLALVDDFKDLFNDVVQEERPLPIIQFSNELDEESIYGESEYRNLYYLFLRYHQVLDNAIKNNVFNSVSMPIIKGVTDMGTFLSENGVWDDVEKKYKLKLDPKKVIVGGEGFDISMLSAYDSVGGAKDLLNILFWLIVQASEVPEFVFGTAVQSSMASVSEQMPVMVRKAKKKQKEFNTSIKQLVETAIYYMSINGNTDVEVGDIKIIWGSILDEDMEKRIRLVETLDSMGLVTDKTKAEILQVGKYVSDVEDEVSEASSEAKDRMEEFQFKPAGVAREEETSNKGKQTPIEGEGEEV